MKNVETQAGAIAAIVVLVGLVSVLGCAAARTRVTFSDEEAGRRLEAERRRSELFDWKTQTPRDFLVFLERHPQPVHFLPELPPPDWVREANLPELFERLESDRPCALVLEESTPRFARSGSTVGWEAARLIQFFRTGLYPSVALPPEVLRVWWREWQRSQPLREWQGQTAMVAGAAYRGRFRFPPSIGAGGLDDGTTEAREHPVRVVWRKADWIPTVSWRDEPVLEGDSIQDERIVSFRVSSVGRDANGEPTCELEALRVEREPRAVMTLADGIWELRINRVLTFPGEVRSLLWPMDEKDFTVVEDGSCLRVAFSAQGERVEIGDPPLIGRRIASSSNSVSFDLIEGTFAGGSFGVSMKEGGLEASLTLFGSGLPILSSERGPLRESSAPCAETAGCHPKPIGVDLPPAARYR